MVRRRTGLDMAQADRLRNIAAKHRLPSPASLEAQLEDSPAWQALIDQVLVPETYLFRDAAQLEMIRDSLRLPEDTDGRPLVLWSAGCCGGEEAYTLAILAVQALCGAGHGIDGGTWFALAGQWRVDVLGTDISRAALERAAAGRYRTGALSSFRTTPPAELRYFPQASPAWRTVRPDLRRLVRFRREGLLQSRPEPASCDVVACRNVLFYLAEEARTQALDTLARTVRPGGLLALGPADPTPDPARFTTIWGRSAVIYRRNDASGTP